MAWTGPAAFTVALGQACVEGPPPCPEYEEQIVALPSGTFEPALTNHYVDSDGGALFEGSFPGGETNANADADPDDVTPGGTTVPSARLEIDRAARVLVRSYVDAEGRTIEERWNMAPVTP